jgi:hypothetical protein
MLTQDYLQAWLRAFIFTQVIEIPVWRWTTKVPYQKAFALSAVTHPFVWFAFPLLWSIGVPYWAYGALSEVFAWGVEAILVRRWCAPERGRWKHVTLASLAANGASLGLGELCRYFWQWP